MDLQEVVQLHRRWAEGAPEGVRADLTGAHLTGANLTGADLTGANLTGADLTEANLRWANLTGADLTEANLTGARLTGANLRRADLRWANLTGADLTEANLTGANLPDLAVARLTLVPAEGSFVAWKACREGVIVKIRVPDGARRSNATGRKCRAEFVDVVEVFGGDFGISQYDERVTYHVGQRVSCHTWEPDRWQECAGGIHFFMTRAEAEAYA